MSPNKSIFYCAVLLFLFPQDLFAHAVEGTVIPAESFCAKFNYDDGEPISYAEISIMLSGEKLPFQKGRTDANGRFCFYPGESGLYKIKVSDGMGHAMELLAEANLAKSMPLKENIDRRVEAGWQKAVTGVSLIFGLFGLMMMFKMKRKSADE